MALNYTVLFDRFGNAIKVIDVVSTFRATDMPTYWGNLVVEYDGADPNLRACLGDSSTVLANAVAQVTALQNWAANTLGQTLIQTLNDETPLSTLSVGAGVAELVRLMGVDGKTVDANAVSAVVTAGGSNAGTGLMLVSLLDGRGQTLEYVYDETIDVTFTSTTQLQCLGEVAAASLLSEVWPLGSGSRQGFDAIESGGFNDLLSGGTMEVFTVANIPDGWTVVVGTAGTDFGEEASVVYKGAKALKFIGGAATTQLKQALTGLSSLTPYAFNMFCKVSSAPGAGQLVIDLYDGTSVINDEAGNANSFSVNLVTLGTTYVSKSGIFRLPEPVPATVELRIRLQTALSATKTLYIDDVAFGAMTQLYTGGPFAVSFVGSTAFSLDDTFSLAITNDYGGAVQCGAWRALNMPELGYKLPSDAVGGENILDSVIP